MDKPPLPENWQYKMFSFPRPIHDKDFTVSLRMKNLELRCLYWYGASECVLHWSIFPRVAVLRHETLYPRYFVANARVSIENEFVLDVSDGVGVIRLILEIISICRVTDVIPRIRVRRKIALDVSDEHFVGVKI